MEPLYHFIIPACLLALFLTLFLLFHRKKRAVLKKINAMSMTEKKWLLDSLALPVGYCYDPCQDIFTTSLDAPQKQFGYTSLYDRSAPYFNMVFDYETIYFNYNDRTWLVEMWKGQYGINSGCELGIYYADRIVPPDAYSSTLFRAVEEKDMPDIALCLNRYPDPESCHCTGLGHISCRHWWLTVFKMGIFTKPQQLAVNTSIRFKDYPMMHRFLDSFQKTLPDISCRTRGLTVFFTFGQSSRKYSPFRKLVRRMALAACHIYCKWFLFLTRPCSQSGDRILYLYYYLPFAIRLVFKGKKRK